MPKKLDLAGKRFGRLVGVRPVGRTPDHAVIWLFKCDCGTEKAITGKVVARGDVSSCGCWARESRSITHRKHGAHKTPAYYAWRNMLNRCYWEKDKAFKNYGARGITVCDRWKDFSNFLEDMGQPPPGMTLDRIDNNKGYSPENCRWATRIEQGNNKRNNVKITYRGQALTIPEWSRRLGLNEGTLRARIFSYGWSVERAFSEGVQH